MGAKSPLLAPRPEIVPVYNNMLPTSFPRLHWYDRPGGGWTEEGALGLTLLETTVHWSEVNTPSGHTDAEYLEMIGREAYYHAFQRNWGNTGVPGGGGDGIMYHYMIAPNGTIFQVTAETHRTWNSYAANAWNLAVCMMAGHGDAVTGPAATSLTAMLEWFCYGRPDLPGITPTPQVVTALSQAGPTMQLHTLGVKTHDESLMAQGRPGKGCCGIYVPIVQAWRAKQVKS